MDSLEFYKEKLSVLGIHTKSNSRPYILRLFREAERKIRQIQAAIKGLLARQHFDDLLAQDMRKISILRNTVTLFGEEFSSLEPKDFYILTENGQSYGFDLHSIWEWVCHHGNHTNPYTNNEISEESQRQICRIYTHHYGDHTNPTTPTLNLQEDYNSRLTDLFIQIESMGCYANMEGYKTLSGEHMWLFFSTMYYDYETFRRVIPRDKFGELSEIASGFKDPIWDQIIKSKILHLLEMVFLDPSQSRGDQEERGLIFTLHLSKFLSPNNDELEHYYIYNINFLIEHIIQHNTFMDESMGDEDMDLPIPNMLLHSSSSDD